MTDFARATKLLWRARAMLEHVTADCASADYEMALNDVRDLQPHFISAAMRLAEAEQEIETILLRIGEMETERETND